jgi:hypothetical protein
MDLHLFYINRVAGKEFPEIPGVLIMPPPRRTARGRGEDILVFMLSLSGNDDITPAAQQEMLQTTAAEYFSTSGSSTAALRSAIDHLNTLLLNRNLKNSRSGIQVTGKVNAIVVRGGLLFAAHAGATHTFYLQNEQVQDWTDLESSDRGLGLSKTVNLRFYQSEVVPGDLAVLCTMPPASWTPGALMGSPALSVDGLRRRLTTNAGPDLQAVVIRLTEGRGQVFRRRLTETTVTPSEPPPTPQKPSPVEPAAHPRPSMATRPPLAAQSQSVTPVTSEPQPATPSAEIPPVSHPIRPASQRPVMAAPVGGQPRPKPKITVAPRQPGDELRDGILSTMRWYRRLTAPIRDVWVRLFPNGIPQLPVVNPGFMLFSAIAIPVIVVAIATTVYFNSGRSEQHQQNLAQANQVAVQAQSAADPAQQRALWEQALQWLDRADSYGVSEEADNLRDVAQAALDSLNGVSRLSLHLALPSDLPDDINITALAAGRTQDIFFLDSNDGVIYHLTRRDQLTYEVDNSFTCTPGVYGVTSLGPIIDMVSLPPNNISLTSATQPGMTINDAVVMGLDGNGSVIYCAPNAYPIVSSLVPSSIGWSTVVGMALDERNLYVLDSGSNRVWRFQSGTTPYIFSDQGSGIFGDTVPSELTTVTDIAAVDGVVYLLRQNSNMIRCPYDAEGRTYEGSDTTVVVVTTVCDDPAAYQDMRTGTAAAFSLDGIQFVQANVISYPSLSMYLLDANMPALYQFGLQLNLFRILRLEFDRNYPQPDAPVAAFMITYSQEAFVAAGSRIYFASLP